MKRFLQLIKRELKLFFSDKTLLTVFFGAPILYAVLLGFVYHSGKVVAQKIIIVDEDNSPLSQQLIEMLEDNEKIWIDTIIAEQVLLKDLVVERNAVAVVSIPARFEASVLQKRYPEINTFINTTNLVTANLTSQALQVTLGTFNVGLEVASLKKQGMSEAKAMQSYEPVKINFVRLFNPTGNYFTYMWPAFLAVVLQQVILLAMAVSFAREAEKGTFKSELIQITPNAFVMLLVKVLPFWVFSFAILALFYGFHGLFNAPIPNPLWAFALTAALFIASCTFLGALISAFIPNALKATQILMVLAAPSFLIGGYSWPSDAMPQGIQMLASMIPLTPFLSAHKMMLMQNATLEQCWPYLQHLILLLVVYAVLALVVLSVKRRKGLKSSVKE